MLQPRHLSQDAHEDKVWYSRPFLQQCLSVLGFLLFQTPWYIVRWLASLLQLPTYFKQGHLPTDQDIVDLIEGTGLCMLLQRLPGTTPADEVMFKFQFSRCMLVLAGQRLQSLSIVYSKSTGNQSIAR